MFSYISPNTQTHLDTEVDSLFILPWCSCIPRSIASSYPSLPFIFPRLPLLFISLLWCNFQTSISATNRPMAPSKWPVYAFLSARPLFPGWEVDLRLGITWSASLLCTHRKSFVHEIGPQAPQQLFIRWTYRHWGDSTVLNYFNSHSVYMWSHTRNKRPTIEFKVVTHHLRCRLTCKTNECITYCLITEWSCGPRKPKIKSSEGCDELSGSRVEQISKQHLSSSNILSLQWPQLNHHLPLEISFLFRFITSSPSFHLFYWHFSQRWYWGKNSMHFNTYKTKVPEYMSQEFFWHNFL